MTPARAKKADRALLLTPGAGAGRDQPSLVAIEQALEPVKNAVTETSNKVTKLEEDIRLLSQQHGRVSTMAQLSDEALKEIKELKTRANNLTCRAAELPCFVRADDGPNANAMANGNGKQGAPVAPASYADAPLVASTAPDKQDPRMAELSDLLRKLFVNMLNEWKEHWPMPESGPAGDNPPSTKPKGGKKPSVPREGVTSVRNWRRLTAAGVGTPGRGQRLSF